jgi:prepilin-type N-terminal cleavage/methylation domain-containing protein
MPDRLRHRKGFTLAEVAIAAVVMAIIAAVTAPSLVNFIDKQRAQTTANTLSAIATGIAAFETAVTTAGGTTNTYPERISYLTNAITTAQYTSCHTNFTITSVANWTALGPFVTFYIPVGGVNTPLGVVQDSMVRNPAGLARPGTLAIQMTGIDASDADMLDQVVDGGDGGAAGIVQYTLNGTTANVSYLVPVKAKC